MIFSRCNLAGTFIYLTLNRMIVAKTFTSERAMTQWLADPKNVENLKKKYPPKNYTADLNLVDKQVEIRER